MRIIKTMPGAVDFSLFQQTIHEIYPEAQWALKATETLATQHLKQCFVLLIEDKPVARAAVYHNKQLFFEGHRTATIGAYESINDNTIATQLHEILEQYCKDIGATFIIGPMNGSTWESYRFNQMDKHPLFFTEQLLPLYYNDLFQMWGMREISCYYSSYTYELEKAATYMIELQAHFEAMGIIIRPIDINQYEEELASIHPFLMDAFKTNFLYTPIDKADFIAKYGMYKPYINPAFVLLAEDKNQQIVGLYFCIEDFLNKEEKTMIIKTIARHPAKEYKGLGQWMGQRIYQTAVENGYKKIIHAFMKVAGTSNNISKQFLGTPFKEYKLYGKSI